MSEPTTDNSAPKGSDVQVTVTERQPPYERWLCWFCGEWHSKKEYEQCQRRSK